MGVQPGMRVADIGAGTGYFLPWLSDAVGPTGHIDATDIAQSLVDYMNAQAKKKGWTNVHARKVGERGPELKKNSVDRILIVNTWHHLADRVRYSREMREALKEGGSLWVVDFTRKSKRGPSRRHKVRPSTVVKELKAAGFQTEVPKENLPEQYIVVGRK
jgi:ubiquinone/menaquinone biosynthesis C-methylase UbiE